jgi:hypothetical protein
MPRSSQFRAKSLDHPQLSKLDNQMILDEKHGRMGDNRGTKNLGLPAPEPHPAIWKRFAPMPPEMASEPMRMPESQTKVWEHQEKEFSGI